MENDFSSRQVIRSNLTTLSITPRHDIAEILLKLAINTNQSINHHPLGSLEEAKYLRLTIDQVSFDLFHYFQQFLVYSRFIYVIKNLPWKLGYRKMLLRRLPVSKNLRPHPLSLKTARSFLLIQLFTALDIYTSIHSYKME